MSIKINYSKKNFGKISSNLVFFLMIDLTSKDFKKDCITNQEFSYISDLIKI